jgi:hypothetical protein
VWDARRMRQAKRARAVARAVAVTEVSTTD